MIKTDRVLQVWSSHSSGGRADEKQENSKCDLPSNSLFSALRSLTPEHMTLSPATQTRIASRERGEVREEVGKGPLFSALWALEILGKNNGPETMGGGELESRLRGPCLIVQKALVSLLLAVVLFCWPFPPGLVGCRKCSLSLLPQLL